jgi:DNA-binding transcriptional ArsR family regulator
MPAEKKPANPEEALHAILKHPLRKQLLRLIVEAGEELRSPRELTVAVNKSISSVGYHVRVLAEQGAVALIDKQPRRGSVEHFYEATPSSTKCPGGGLPSACRPPRATTSRTGHPQARRTQHE